MTPTDIKEKAGIARSTTYRAKNGELKNEELANRIMELLALENDYLEGIFLDERFIGAMEVVIKKAPSTPAGVELRKFAVLAQHTSIALRSRKNKKEQK